jgi:hypothetical protein
VTEEELKGLRAFVARAEEKIAAVRAKASGGEQGSAPVEGK